MEMILTQYTKDRVDEVLVEMGGVEIGYIFYDYVTTRYFWLCFEDDKVSNMIRGFEECKSDLIRYWLEV
jgi:hypothetical protein